jgi:hypothetical protein
MTQKQTLIKEAAALNINVPKKVTIKQLESMIANAKQPAPAPNASSIFSAEETAAQASANKKERQAKALAKSQRENKVNNTLVTATIRVRQRITKTAIIEIALSVAATQIDHVSCQQVAAYIEKEIADNVRYKHESNIATRVRNHCRAAMKKLCIVDSNDIIHFTESFKNIATDPKHAERVNALLSELKNS